MTKTDSVPESWKVLGTFRGKTGKSVPVDDSSSGIV